MHLLQFQPSRLDVFCSNFHGFAIMEFKTCMARSGVGIIRFLPHSLGEWTLCPGRPMSDEPRSHLIAPCCMHWMMAMILAKCLNSLCYGACFMFDPFTNKLMMLLLDDFFVKSLSYVLAVWPCQFFVCLGPRCRPVLGRHCYEQLTLLPGFDDRAMTCPWILVASYPVASYGLYTHAFWQLQELSKLTNLFEDRQSTPERTLRWLL